MRFFRHHPQRFNLFCLVVFSTLPGVSGGAVWGLDYEIIASGPLKYTYNYSSTFDGTTFGTLPSFLHLDRLQGGSFKATFRFTQIPAHGGNDTIYFLSPSSGVTNYELLDAAGVVVHQGSNPSAPTAYVSDNYGEAPYIVDNVYLTSQVNRVTGSYTPTVHYSESLNFTSDAHLSVSGYISGDANYLNGVGIPTDSSTYLSFPAETRMFEVRLTLADGDYNNKRGPYQDAVDVAQYEISSLQITAVPEPAEWSILTIASICVLRRQRRCRDVVTPQLHW